MGYCYIFSLLIIVELLKMKMDESQCERDFFSGIIFGSVKETPASKAQTSKLRVGVFQ